MPGLCKFSVGHIADYHYFKEVLPMGKTSFLFLDYYVVTIFKRLTSNNQR